MAAVNTFLAHLARKLEANGSETTVYLDRITTRTGETITTSQFTSLGRGILTINPDGDGETNYPEWASFTAVDSSAVSLTGVTRGLSALGNSVVTANKRFHPVGTPVVISFGVHNFQDILDKIDNEIATVTVGTSNAVTGTAGETIATAPALVYLKNDGKWWLTDADTTATIENVQIGLALSAVAADASITNGIVRKGLVSGFSGLVAGTTYYASNTAGQISSSAGTNSLRVGEAKSSTELYFDPVSYELPTGKEKAAMAGAGAAPSSTNKYLTEGDIDDNTIFIPPSVVTFTSSGTWTKDAGLKYVVVEVVGAGGGGGKPSVSDTGGGGGGGGYARKLIAASSLGATETVTVGAGGTGTTSPGGTGGTTSFGAHVSATGGAGGVNGGSGGAGGAGASGDINITGQGGGGGAASSSLAGTGGSSVLGGGGLAEVGGGVGVQGGNYGGGGSGGQNNNNGGSGAGGIVIVTEHYS